MKARPVFVEIYVARGEAEAELIRGMLEDCGIPSMLKSHAAPSVHAFTIDGMGQFKIMVPQCYEEKAKELIRKDNDAEVV